MYTIKLQNGTVLENLTKNGDNFISETKIEPEVFAGNLEVVEIISEEGTETLKDLALLSDVANPLNDGKYWFAFAQKDERTKREELVEKSITDIQVALAEVFEMISETGA